MLGNILVALIILAIIGGASAKVIMDKRKGVVCSGCPHAGNKNCSCNH